jgi:hypothetical protein
VLQEVCLGFDISVRCGAFKIPWNTFAAAIKVLSYAYSQEFRYIHARATSQVLSIQQGKAPLLELLWRHHSAEYSDYRDRIYALLGMATHIRLSPGVRHDDERSEWRVIRRVDGPMSADVSYVDSWYLVYQAFARKIVKSGHGSQLLIHARAFGSLGHRNSKYPSWVPDWRRARNTRWTLGDWSQNTQWNLDQRFGSFSCEVGWFETKVIPDGRIGWPTRTSR